jgi:hypothetical protein
LQSERYIRTTVVSLAVSYPGVGYAKVRAFGLLTAITASLAVAVLERWCECGSWDRQPAQAAAGWQAAGRALHARRAEFEAAYGRPLEWEPMEGRKACRIFEPSERDVQDESRHEKCIDFFIDAGERFRRAIGAVDGGSL